MTCYQITAPHFCAGLIVTDGGAVVQAAPILRWACGKSWDYVRRWAERKGYEVQYVE